MISEKLMKISLPVWSELPDRELSVEELVDYVHNQVGIFLPEKNSMTKYMINNYVKRNIFPKPVKRRYNREHISTAIVYSILKPVLEVGEIDKAITTYEGVLTYEDTYNEFVDSFDYMKKEIIRPLLNFEEMTIIRELKWSRRRIAMMSAIASFLFLLLTRDALEFHEKYKKENSIV